MASCKECIHYEVCIVVRHNGDDRVLSNSPCKRYIPTADVVEVVRCKDCAYRRVPTRCSLWMGTTGENEYFREHGDNFYCAFGTPKERGGSE